MLPEHEQGGAVVSDAEYAYRLLSDRQATSPYAAHLETWLNLHLDTTWPPVDAELAAAKVRALTTTPAVLR